MPATALKFRFAPGVKRTRRRAVGFIYGDPQLNASDAFESLNENTRRYILSSMGEWVDFKNDMSQRFHGFKNESLEYRLCFVFKAKQKRRGHRLYGFLCHPLDEPNAGLQLCVLCIHATKNERDTDKSELGRVNEWSKKEIKNEVMEQLELFPLDEGIGAKKGIVLQWRK